MALTALLPDASHLRAYLDDARARQPGVDARWSRELSPLQRTRARALITANHHIGRKDLDAWLRAYPGVEMLSLAFTGYDGVDLDELKRRNIAVHYSPDYATGAVAELVLGLAIALLRRLGVAERSLREGRWDKGDAVPGAILRGRTVGILGIGRIGLETARLFRALGCDVQGWSRSKRAEFAPLGRQVRTAEDLFATSDIVTVHLPSNADTQQFVNKQRLHRMKKTALLINTSRPHLVDTVALAGALRRKKIAGAAVDVFDSEPLLGAAAVAANALLALDRRDLNLITTPHVGFKTEGSYTNLALRNVQHYAAKSTENQLVGRRATSETSARKGARRR